MPLRQKASLLDLGLMDYRRAYGLQLDLVEKRRTGRLDTDIFLLTEHPAVFTLGRRGGQENLAVSREFLDRQGIALIPIERGGDITYHGRGQLVVYPIILLKSAGLSVTEYIFRLEEVMIRLSRDYGVAAVRDARNHGVWSGDRKLGSVGIAIRHGVAFHGLAINVTTCLEHFGWINPCGLTGVRMTSLARELGREMALEEAKQRMKGHLAEIFERDFSLMGLEPLLE
ncbi:MAG: lipoyl(octanoyl) transferase LipB [Desulfocapsaceae bacterium]|nr:lipoyl(octanoyl) transferase LipB [Desulfocapsaceae bacterium]